MNTVETFFAQPLVMRIGWTLVHFVWQGVVVAFLLAISLQALRSRTSNARYTAACIALMLMAAMPLGTFALIGSPHATAELTDLAATGMEPPNAGRPVPGQSSLKRTTPERDQPGMAVDVPDGLPLAAGMQSDAVDAAASAPPVWQRVSAMVAPFLPLVVALWLMGVSVLSLRLLGGWLQVQRLKRRGIRPVTAGLQEAVGRLSQRLRISRPVTVLASALVRVPTAIGWLRPVILLPASALTSLPPEQLEAILAHELAHIRRYDYLVNLIQTVIETVLFYHPAVWWVSRQIRIEREHCCDDLAVGICGDRVIYARALAAVAELGGALPQLAAAADGGDLLSRVRRVVGLSSPPASRFSVWSAGALAFGLVLALALSAWLPGIVGGAKASQAATGAVEAPVTHSPVGELPAEAASVVDLVFEKLPVEFADFFCIQGIGPPDIPAEKPAFCRSDRPLLWHNPKSVFPIAILFDESGGTGKGHDTLYIDFDNDGEFLDNPVYKAVPFRGEKGPDGAPVAAYFENVHIPRSGRRGLSAHVQVFLEHAGGFCGFPPSGPQTHNCVIIPQKWAVGSVKVDGVTMPAALIDRDWDDRFVTKKGLNLKEHPQRFARGDYLVLGIDGEKALIPGERFLRQGGSAHGILTDYLVLNSGIYRVQAEQFEEGVRLELIPAELPTGTVNLSVQPEDNRLLLIGTKTCVLLSNPGRQITLPADTYYAPLYYRLLFSVEADKATVVAPPRIRGTVTDAETGEPIKEFRVRRGVIYPETEQPHWYSGDRNVQSFTNGKYEVVFPVPYPSDDRQYALRFEARGYYPAQSPPFRIDKDEQVFGVQMKPGKGPSGIVLLPDGRPAQGAKVGIAVPGRSIQISNGQRLYPETNTTETDADGRFELPPVDTDYKVVVVHEAGCAEVSRKDLEASPTVVLKPWGRVEGTLLIGRKRGAKQSIVLQIMQPFEPKAPSISIWYSATTDEEGRFAFDRVIPGEAQVAHSIPTEPSTWGPAQVVYVEVKPGETSRVSLGGKGRPIVGRLVLRKDFSGTIRWEYASARLATRLDLPKPKLPDDWYEMDADTRRQWLEAWRKTDEGKAYEAAVDKAIRAQRLYTFAVKPDGSFRAEDVQAGTYQLSIRVYEAAEGGIGRWARLIGSVSREVVVPEMPGGRSDEPLDLGNLQLQIMNRLEIGDAAPPFEVKMLDGKPLRLADYRGKFVLLDFWATWCGPCLGEIPHLKAVWDAFGKDERFVMISLSLDQSVEPVKKMVAAKKMSWLHGFLGEWSQTDLPNKYSVEGIPSIFLIGPDGRLIATNLRGPAIKEAVGKALSESTTPSVTQPAGSSPEEPAAKPAAEKKRPSTPPATQPSSAAGSARRAVEWVPGGEAGRLFRSVRRAHGIIASRVERVRLRYLCRTIRASRRQGEAPKRREEFLLSGPHVCRWWHWWLEGQNEQARLVQEALFVRSGTLHYEPSRKTADLIAGARLVPGWGYLLAPLRFDNIIRYSELTSVEVAEDKIVLRFFFARGSLAAADEYITATFERDWPHRLRRLVQTGHGGKVRAVWVFDEYGTFGNNIEIPRRITQKIFAAGDRLLYAIESVLEKVEFPETLPDSAFALDLPKGTYLTDYVAGQSQWLAEPRVFTIGDLRKRFRRADDVQARLALGGAPLMVRFAGSKLTGVERLNVDDSSQKPRNSAINNVAARVPDRGRADVGGLKKASQTKTKAVAPAAATQPARSPTRNNDKGGQGREKSATPSTDIENRQQDASESVSHSRARRLGSSGTSEVGKATGEAWPAVAGSVRTAEAPQAVSSTNPAGRRFVVRIVDRAGKPVPGAQVYVYVADQHGILQEFRGLSDRNGRFVCDNVARDRVSLSVSKQGFRHITGRHVSVSDAEHVITLLRNLTVTGTVRDATTGKPIERFVVIPGLTGSSGPVSWRRREALTCRGGRYKWQPREQWLNLIRVEADGYKPAVSLPFFDCEGSVTYDFNLEPAKTIAGRLLLPDGKPAAGAEVFVVTASRNMSTWSGRIPPHRDWPKFRTAEDGRFRLWPQEEHFSIVVFDERGWAFVTQEQLEKSGDVMLQPWARIELEVRLGGRPRANQPVFLEWERTVGREKVSYHGETRTDEQGLAVFARVPPGRAKVGRFFWIRQGYGKAGLADHARILNLKPGQTAKVVIGNRGRTVVGRVVSADGRQFDFDSLFVLGWIRNMRDMPLPDDYFTMTEEQCRAWYEAWTKTEQGRAWLAEEKEVKRCLQSGNAKTGTEGCLTVDRLPPAPGVIFLQNLFRKTGFLERL